MSYLDPLRLCFAGQFQAAPSTVNNDITHFDNASFKPQFQQRQTGKDANGWWNPSGDAVFRLANCKVTAAFSEGVRVANDLVLDLLVVDSGTQPPAKMVDLDPEQQMVSQIWGLQIRLCTGDGANVLVTDFDLTSFTELWVRDITDDQGKVGDSVFSAMYQSVLSNVRWTGTRSSSFIEKLAAASSTSGLSIKFNVDGYNMTWGSPLFTYGRIVGTIGPHSANEPKRFTLGRHLVPAVDASGNQLYPVNYCAAVVDPKTSKVLIDLGNALPTDGIGGPQSDRGILSLAYRTEAGWASLGSVDYLGAGWYTEQAGIATIPLDRQLTKAEVAALESSELAVQLLAPGSAGPVAALIEPTGGQYVRADQFVFRLNPGESAEADLWITQWGKTQGGAAISVAADSSQLQSQANWPPVATPANAIDFPTTVTANANGRATLSIRASDPENPRGYIDGQVYGVRPLPAPAPAGYIQNSWDFISLLVWDEFKAGNPITWHGSIQPIFQQYANLYPVMARFVDMSSYDQICAERNLQLLRLAFGLEMTNPNSMPVTRDLSDSRRGAILKWLTEVGSDGKPLLGRPSDAPQAAFAERTTSVDGASPESVLAKGGKMAAMARRIGLRKTGGKENQ